MKELKSKQWLIFSIIILALGGAWIWISKAPANATSTGGIPAPRQGFMAPDFSLQTLDGKTITLSELRGRPLIVNIWATWCPPCQAEMPAFERVYNQYKDDGFLILAVNLTNQDNPENVSAFVEKFGLTFPILLDTDGKVASIYQSNALPTSYFINENGIIQEVVIGGPMSEAMLRIRVEELLNK